MIQFNLLSCAVRVIFDENPSLIELAWLVAVLAVFWAIFFALFAACVKPFVYGKSWLVDSLEREYHRAGKELDKDMGIVRTKDDFIECGMNNWPWMQAMTVQHFVGGCLCLPSILGIGEPSTASSLACLGILSEMGWEIEDMIVWLHRRFFTLNGEMKAPTPFLLVLIIHHSLTTFLGLPVVIFYRKNKLLHWICFELQLAGATTLLCVELSKLLDVSKLSELRKFQGLTLYCLIVLIWTRGIHWVYLSSKFIMIWYEEKAWAFLTIGSFVIFLFNIFNVFVAIIPMYKRLNKFMQKSAEYTALPKHVDKKKRRDSALQLQSSARNVLDGLHFENELAKVFTTRRVTRRRTICTIPSRSKPCSEAQRFRRSSVPHRKIEDN